MLPIKTILHPTDFSDASEQARRMAEGLAHDYGARLILVHAVEPPVFSNEVAYEVAATEQYRDEAKRRIAAIAAADEGATLKIEHRLADGVASAEIVRIAGEESCDLIVIGSHGRSGIGRVLMGSVAEDVARKAPCPVLIVRNPPGEGPSPG